MALNARKVKNTSGPKAPLLDEGAYPARLVQVIDLGLQPQEYKGETKPPKNEMWHTYELSDEFMPGEDGEPDETKPRWLSERLPLNSLGSDLAKSTKRYYALDPKEEHDGDWTALLGSPAILAVTVNGEYNNIGGTSTMRPKEAAKCPELVNDTKVFSMDDPDVEVFLSLPDFLQKIIKDGLEFEGSKLDGLLAKHKGGDKPVSKTKEVVEDDNIPFDNEPEADTDDGDEW